MESKGTNDELTPRETHAGRTRVAFRATKTASGAGRGAGGAGGVLVNADETLAALAGCCSSLAL